MSCKCHGCPFSRFSDLPEVHQLTLMDELEQKCYDLDAKVRRVEEERDAVMNENEELHDQVRCN